MSLGLFNEQLQAILRHLNAVATSRISVLKAHRFFSKIFELNNRSPPFILLIIWIGNNKQFPNYSWCFFESNNSMDPLTFSSSKEHPSSLFTDFWKQIASEFSSNLLTHWKHLPCFGSKNPQPRTRFFDLCSWEKVTLFLLKYISIIFILLYSYFFSYVILLCY